MVLGATAEALHFTAQFPSTAYEEMGSDCQRLNRSCKVNLYQQLRVDYTLRKLSNKK
ncbi:hypothetical protein [Alkalihalobacillus alcalophilus]|uniref:hypothetical protein n=1 Tax=Alkalihalobacillus alcalophilus TaxID=1445 RepID=UPI0013631E8B|nr:hypothetical protein [Alkalihalobacillus alcalophilus]